MGSLVGLAATLWTAWSAYRSKRYYLLVGRVPELIGDLVALNRALAKAIAEGGSDAELRQQALPVLKQMRVTLESIGGKLGRRQGRDFRALARRIRQMEDVRDLNDPARLDVLWAESVALVAQAGQLVNDAKFARD